VATNQRRSIGVRSREKASLILRRQRQKLYNVDDDSVWSKERFEAQTPEAKTRFSRLPLTAGEIEALIDVAINLHTRAAERARDRLWWVAPTLAFAGALLGGVITKLI
jgi:hypothetical protein